MTRQSAAFIKNAAIHRWFLDNYESIDIICEILTLDSGLPPLAALLFCVQSFIPEFFTHTYPFQRRSI